MTPVWTVNDAIDGLWRGAMNRDAYNAMEDRYDWDVDDAIGGLWAGRYAGRGMGGALGRS